MSSGQTPRTPTAFPRMKVRGRKRRRCAARRRFRAYVPPNLSSRSAFINALRDIGELTRVLAKKTALPKLWVTW